MQPSNSIISIINSLVCVEGGGEGRRRGGGEGERERPGRGGRGERPVHFSKALFKMYENCDPSCLDAELVTGYET